MLGIIVEYDEQVGTTIWRPGNLKLGNRDPQQRTLTKYSRQVNTLPARLSQDR